MNFDQELRQALKEIGIGPAYRKMIVTAVIETIARQLVDGTLSIRGWVKITTNVKERKVWDIHTRGWADRVVVLARASVGKYLRKALHEKWNESADS